MCNLSIGVYQKGYAEGYAQGFKLGLEDADTEGAMEILFGIVQDQLLTIKAAAKRAGVDETLFEQQYKTYLIQNYNAIDI